MNEFSLVESEFTAENALMVRNRYAEVIDEFKAEATRRAVWDGCSKERAVDILPGISRQTARAMIVMWEEEMWKAAWQGCEAFENEKMRSDLRPPQPQLWLWRYRRSFDPRLKELFGLSAQAELCAVLLESSTGFRDTPEADRAISQGWADVREKDRIFSGREGLRVTEFWYELDRSARDFHVPLLRSYPVLWDGGLISEMDAAVTCVAALKFMQLPFVSMDKPSMSRQVRRQLERKEGGDLPIRVITLRRSEHKHTGGPGKEAEWSCQWMVKGHWRKRAERWGEGSPSYVTPHIKGPKDKPFRAPRETVYKVRR